jgi:hypothetical protein
MLREALVRKGGDLAIWPLWVVFGLSRLRLGSIAATCYARPNGRVRPQAAVVTNKIKEEHQRMSKPWFGPRKFGFGWTPFSWEGWACTFLVVVVFTGLIVTLF